MVQAIGFTRLDLRETFSVKFQMSLVLTFETMQKPNITKILLSLPEVLGWNRWIKNSWRKISVWCHPIQQFFNAYNSELQPLDFHPISGVLYYTVFIGRCNIRMRTQF